MAFMCARIWCVRPVSSIHSTSVVYPNLSMTLQCVTAGLPVSEPGGRTVMRNLSLGSRAMFPSMRPLSSAMCPHTRAMYERWVVLLKNCLPRFFFASGVLAMSSSPEVSLSMRWTRPTSGELGSYAGTSLMCHAMALTSVPVKFPAPGWTTIPAFLFTTSSSSSS